MHYEERKKNDSILNVFIFSSEGHIQSYFGHSWTFLKLKIRFTLSIISELFRLLERPKSKNGDFMNGRNAPTQPKYLHY